MRSTHISRVVIWGVSLILGTIAISCKPKQAAPAETPNGLGSKLQAEYEATLKTLRAEILETLPTANEQTIKLVQDAREDVRRAQAQVDETAKALGGIYADRSLADQAKGKWIADAEKGITQAEAALKNAVTPAEREAAQKELAKWQANKEEAHKAHKELQATYHKEKYYEPRLNDVYEAAKASLIRAHTNDLDANKSLLENLDAFLSSDQLDGKLAKCAILIDATPRGLAEFAQQNPNGTALIEKLLADEKLMKEMLAAGGAKFGKYGQAMKIYTAIQAASPKAGEGALQRLVLATSLEHAVAITQSNPQSHNNAPSVIDPVKRYLHYEKAFLDGELDPAFNNFSTWEYRHVVNSDAPDEILAWGRGMLRNYQPDHISNPDYVWRYVSIVRSEISYGSQNERHDLPSLHHYQNIIKNGGEYGRRASFGRFILRAFGIPTWGVTQKGHAALSHWTPKGWVINFGAGINASWWDDDEAPLSGNQFLMDTQARSHVDEYLKVLRAQWVSRILDEPAYNERLKTEGGFWSSLGHYQSALLAAETASLGQEQTETNNRKKKVESKTVSDDDKQVMVGYGMITIPAVAHNKPVGKSTAMKGPGGMRLHALRGFKTEYAFEVPRSGKYQLTAKVVTLHDGQIFLVSANDDKQPIEIPVPSTVGMWQDTQPVELTLERGENILRFEIKPGGRGVTIKDFTLKPAK